MQIFLHIIVFIVIYIPCHRKNRYFGKKVLTFKQNNFLLKEKGLLEYFGVSFIKLEHFFGKTTFPNKIEKNTENVVCFIFV